MIALLLKALVSKISVFKGLSFLSKALIEFVRFMSNDFSAIIEGIKQNQEIEKVLTGYLTYKRDILDNYGGERNSKNNIKYYLRAYFTESEESMQFGKVIENFGCSLISMGLVIQTINEYCAQNKAEIKGVLSDSLRLTYSERKSLQKDDEANISSRLGIKGMTLTLVVACHRASLILKFDGKTQEIGLKDNDVISDCQHSDLLSLRGAEDLIEAWADCPEFIMSIVDYIIKLSDADIMKLGTPQLGEQTTKGVGETRGG